MSSQSSSLFDAVKGVVADLVAGSHGEHRLPCRVQGGSTQGSMFRARRIEGA
jgi:hypothetical protein